MDIIAVGNDPGVWYCLKHGEAFATSCAWRVVSYHHAGLGRRDIFHEDRDRLHFLELLSELVDRYGVILHAYVLMDNHYHLLIETPFGNASRALQWLNVSFAVWHNVKHRRSGPLFQARYKRFRWRNRVPGR